MPNMTTADRKDSHLDLCATAEVEPAENRSLFECVRLVHCALPELALTDLDTSAELFGKRLALPLVLTGMTGGTERAAAVNRDLATLAERHGLAFGLGSQRAMAEEVATADSYRVRSVAPTAVVVGYVGLTLAASVGIDGVRRLKDSIQADGMALHLNAAQELTQPEGDRDFRGGYQLVERLAAALGDRLLVKETGCGLSGVVARRLANAGVKVLDVSGLGGTSWVRVEQLRAEGVSAEVGAELSGWGIPTAAALVSSRKAVPASVRLVASGGLRTGLDAAKALALGADLVGMALPFFRAQQSGGLAAAERVLEVVAASLRQALLLTGSRDVAELRSKSVVLLGELKDWLAAV